MTKTQIQQMSQGLSDLYTGLETDLIANIAEYLQNGDIYSSTAQWKIQMLAQLGALDKANIKTISNYAGISPALLSQALETASLTAINELEGGFRQLVKDGIINGTDVPVMDTMARTLKSYNKQAKNSLNMVNTVMLYKAKSITGKIINQVAEIADKPEYIAMLSKAAGKVITGIESRQSAMRQCIQEMTDKGIPAFVDKLGREWSPEAYVNMDIRTTLSNTANTAQMERMNDYGINLVEVSSHSGARPKCAKYQGRIFDKSNKSEKYPHWKDTSYGQPDGLLGINCGHQIYPYIEGISIQRYFPYDKKENDRAYRLSQHQRELERRVRKSKRECMVFEKLGDKEGLKRASATLKNRKQALTKFSADNNLPVRTDRTAVVGYNKSVSAKVRNNSSDSSFLSNIKNKIAGNEHLNVVRKFSNEVDNLHNATVKKLLKSALNDTKINKSPSRKNYFSPKENAVYLSRSSTPSTIAHELFHKIDHKNYISKEKMLNKSIDKDYRSLLKNAESAGLSIEDMLYSKYAKAFEKRGKLKEDYRGVSDIINGMTDGKVNLGYFHKTEYWQRSGTLQKETFAQYGRFFYDENSDVMQMVNEIFPETTLTVNNILKAIEIFGG